MCKEGWCLGSGQERGAYKIWSIVDGSVMNATQYLVVIVLYFEDLVFVFIIHKDFEKNIKFVHLAGLEIGCDSFVTYFQIMNQVQVNKKKISQNWFEASTCNTCYFKSNKNCLKIYPQRDS